MKSGLRVPRPAREPIVFHSLADVPPLPVSLGSTLYNRTGSWRYIRPKYEDRTPPCNRACPAGSNIVRYIGALRAGGIEAAWRTLVSENPLPGVCGRVCPHPCETACNRAGLGGAIAVHALERYLADEAKAHHWRPDPAEERRPGRVAIVGSGPAGLSCAYHLARLGYVPEVFEAENEVGGLLSHAIPAYRLARSVLYSEVANIESLGVRFQLNRRLGGDLYWEELQRFDAVFLGVGQGLSRPLHIPGESNGRVIAGLHLLRQVAKGHRPELGSQVLVVGGGNTAMDAARTAVRLGAAATVVYRRTAQEMPAIAEGVEEARAEGVAFRFLASPVEVLVHGGRLRGLLCQEMRLGENDSTGRARPEPIPGAEFVLPADTIMVAAGQQLDVGPLRGLGMDVHNGLLLTNHAAQTTLAHVFAGGDAATGEGTVAQAIGSGKRAALAIDRYMRTNQAEGLPPLGEALQTIPRQASSTEVQPGDLNLDHIESAPRPSLPHRQPAERIGDLAEVNLGIGRDLATQEGARCISCGTCSACDTCLIFCPDVAIARAPGGGYTIAYDYCKGCGICAVECPRAAVVMERQM